MTSLIIRPARKEDVREIVHLVNAGGPGGKPRGVIPDPFPLYYFETFEKISANPSCRLMVAEMEGKVIGTFQLNFLTYLAAKGRDDIQVEAIHVKQEYRGQGIGTEMMKWVIAEAKRRNCRRIQLTSDKTRQDAHRFYERCGFKATHEGMKLVL